MKRPLRIVHEHRIWVFAKPSRRTAEGCGPSDWIVRRKGLGADRRKERESVPLSHPKSRGPVQCGAEEKPREVSIVEMMMVGVCNDRTTRKSRGPLPKPTDSMKCAAEVKPKKAFDQVSEGRHGSRMPGTGGVSREGLIACDGAGIHRGKREKAFAGRIRMHVG